MNRRTTVATAGAITVTLLAGSTALAANLGILERRGTDTVGDLSPVSDSFTSSADDSTTLPPVVDVTSPDVTSPDDTSPDDTSPDDDATDPSTPGVTTPGGTTDVTADDDVDDVDDPDDDHSPDDDLELDDD